MDGIIRTNYRLDVLRLKKSIRRWRFVVPTTHSDLPDDFQPDVLIVKGFEIDGEIIKNDFAKVVNQLQ